MTSPVISVHGALTEVLPPPWSTNDLSAPRRRDPRTHSSSASPEPGAFEIVSGSSCLLWLLCVLIIVLAQSGSFADLTRLLKSPITIEANALTLRSTQGGVDSDQLARNVARYWHFEHKQ